MIILMIIMIHISSYNNNSDDISHDNFKVAGSRSENPRQAKSPGSRDSGTSLSSGGNFTEARP